jgi:hypothetical protein
MVPQAGFFGSSVLGLELRVEDGRVRYYHGNAQLLVAPELIAKLERLSEQQALRAEEESRRAEEESRRADELARRVAELEAQLAKRR